MGTVSIDLRSLDTSERRGQLGGSSHAAGSSNEGPEPDDSDAADNEARLRGVLQPTSSEDQAGNVRRLPAEDAEPRGQILKLAYPKGKRNSGKKATRCKRKKNLVPSYYLSSSQVHTTSSSRRFWNFFDFSCKEEPASRDEKKCLPSNGIVSSSLFSNDALDAVSKSVSPNPVTTTVTFTPKYINDSQLDLKATSMTCLKIQGLMKQDNLVSLLDGNPVPRTLKWKLKGYKTLRNEQAVDFAFVPGAKSYECDILPRNEYHELEQSNRRILPRRKSICSGMENSDENGTLSLTTKAIENKAKIERMKKVDAKDANTVEKESNLERKNTSDVDRPADVSNQKASTCKLLAHGLQSAGPKKEEMKYLPILKSDLSTATSQTKCQTQPVARFSSRPPKKIQKPPAPILNRTEKEANTAKDVSSMELDEEKKAAASEEKQASSLSKPLAPRYSEVAGNASERRSKENRGEERYSMEGEAKARETKNDTSAFQSSAEMSRTEPTEFARDSGKTSEKRQAASRTSTYFAPRAYKDSSHSWNRQSSETEGNRTFESIIGIPENTTVPLKLTRRNEGQGVKSSPCAATQVRLQQNEGRNASNSRTNSFGNDRSSMAGSSDGGSRKPPASFAPFTTRRSSSNSSCLSRKLAVSKRTGNGSKSAFNSNTSSLNISTSSVNAARKCRDNDARCPRARKCEQERPRCKKDKKICKRYCCPALQMPTHCDYSRFQCPKHKIKNAVPVEKYEVKKDPTCMSNENDEQSREFCTTPERSRASDRDCKRQTERKCSRGRRDRSCDRRRRRSCEREERDCSRQDEGRTICTKPRKRDTSCKRRRKCNDRDCDRRSAKCTGRRNYTQSAFSNHSTNVPKNVKRYSSLPAFAFPLITMKNSKEAKQSLFVSPSICKFLQSPLVRSKSDDKCKKPSPKCKVAGGKDEDKCKRPSAKCKLNADAKCKKADSCRKESTKCKKEDPCKKVRGTCEKKEDPCKKTRGTCEKKKEDPCKKLRATCGKREDPCKKTRTTCGKREDPCKKRTSCGPEVKKVEDPCKRVRSASEKKDDPCKKASRPSCSTKGDPCKPSDKLKCSAVKDTKCTLEDSCSRKREKMCQERCMASSTASESAKERLDRERKEIEECKKHIKKKNMKKKESATGLKCATNPCKQQLKDSQSKFASIDLPLQSFVNVISNTCMSQGSNLLNLPRDRSYSILNSVNHDEVNRETDPPEPTKNFWSFNDENVEPVIVPPMDNAPQDDPPVEDVHSGSTSNWLFSWFNCKY